MASYDGAITLRDARSLYFEANDFGDDGGYSKRWVRIKLGKVWILFPNWQARVRAVRVHDLDHVLTGYETDLLGETEIAAYEIASGCGSYSAAWALNLQALVAGLFLSPGRLFAAYRRGRQCRSLYHEEFSEALLAERVGAARTRLGLDLAPFTTWQDPSVRRFRSIGDFVDPPLPEGELLLALFHPGQRVRPRGSGRVDSPRFARSPERDGSRCAGHQADQLPL